MHITPNLSQLSHIINARGTYTPLGVSRSSVYVQQSVAQSLSQFYLLEELHDLVSEAVSSLTGAEAATVSHCTASAITVSIAATMTGTSQALIAALPDTQNLSHHVVIPAPHCINYGHSILQAIRLSGATPVIAGTPEDCSPKDIERCISQYNACCLLLVSSKLIRNHSLDLTEAVALAHKYNLPALIDGAAQDFRVKDLLKTSADLVLVSAQKYLAAPTAGLIIGRKELVESAHAQEAGIGRGMKATKEALVGVLAAIEERASVDTHQWQQVQQQKVNRFIAAFQPIKPIDVKAVPDPTGLPFSRVSITFLSDQAGNQAQSVAKTLKAGSPSIWVIDGNCQKGELQFELIPLLDNEINTIIERLSALLSHSDS